MLPPILQKKAHDLYRAMEIREHRLLYLFFEITRRCNMNCVHCGSDCGKDSRMREMDAETWARIARYVSGRFSPRPFIVVTGGEPTVRKDLPEIARAIHGEGLNWGMVTNGLALTQELMDTLEQNGLGSITLSIDGNEKAHNYLRNNPKSYEAVLKAAAVIGRSGLSVKDCVTCVFGGEKGNLHDLDDVAERLIEKGITSWRLFRIFPKGRGAENPHLRLSAEELQLLLRWLKDRRPTLKKRGLEVSFSCEGYLPFALDRKLRDTPYFCRSGINIASILSDGTVSGCNNNGPEYYEGRIDEGDFKTLWDTGFAKFRNREWLRRGKCADCGQWKDCQGNSLHLREADEGESFCFYEDAASLR